MISILKNNFRRLWVQKQLIVLLIIFTVCASSAAIFVSTRPDTKRNVAIVSDTPFFLEHKQINITSLKQAPPRSQLLSGRYDAVFYMDNGIITDIDTTQNEETISQMLAAINGDGNIFLLNPRRSTGTAILGFLMMFVLLSGSMAMYMYSDDKEQKQIVRIMASPIKTNTYLLSHSLFNFCFLFFPVITILAFICRITKVDLGCHFGTITVLLALICAFSTAFCLVLYSLLSNKAESAKMTGNTIIILTSILAGNFYTFDTGSVLFETLTKLLPQKSFLILAEAAEKHLGFYSYLPQLSYLIILIIIFYIVSLVKTKKQYENAR